MAEADRRPIASRDTSWAKAVAGRLVRSGVTPNAISVTSAVFGALGGAALCGVNRVSPGGASALYVLAALCVQLRLLCNLFDGMVAVEGGKKTPAGEVYNELPDRVSDTLFFLGAGFGAAQPWGLIAGFSAALFAMATAYVRLLGAASGAGHDFAGPMAKQQRMALLTAACLGCAVLVHFGAGASDLSIAALALIALGSLFTAMRRTVRVVHKLQGRA